MTYLVLGKTKVTLQGLQSLKALRNLNHVGWNFTSGRGPEELTEIDRLFPRLKHFEMNSVVYNEADIAALAALRNIEFVTIHGNLTTDATLRGLAALKRLQRLWLTFASITDAGLATVASHESITEILCNETKEITDAGIMHLVAMKQLLRLELRNNPKLTPAGLTAFQKARPDVTLVR